MKRYAGVALLILSVFGYETWAHAITIINTNPPFATYVDSIQGFGLVNVNAFRGNDVTPDGKTNLAFDAWDADLGRPVRDATFGIAADPTVPPGGRVLSTIMDFTHINQVSDSSGASYTAFISGGDAPLIPLMFDPDNMIVAQGTVPPGCSPGTSCLQGVQRPDDLRVPNINLLVPGGNNFVMFAFADAINSQHIITAFGRTESFGVYVSTTDTVMLTVFDQSGLPISSVSQSPPTLSPFFIGFTLPDKLPDGTSTPQHPLIASALISFSDSGTDGVVAGIDGVVYTSLREGVFTAPIPEPSTLLLLGSGVVGVCLWGRRRIKG